jgi:hypothetical protein
VVNVQSALPIGKLSQSQDQLILAPKRSYYFVGSEIGGAFVAGEATSSKMMKQYHRYSENKLVDSRVNLDFT